MPLIRFVPPVRAYRAPLLALAALSSLSAGCQNWVCCEDAVGRVYYESESTGTQPSCRTNDRELSRDEGGIDPPDFLRTRCEELAANGPATSPNCVVPASQQPDEFNQVSVYLGVSDQSCGLGAGYDPSAALTVDLNVDQALRLISPGENWQIVGTNQGTLYPDLGVGELPQGVPVELELIGSGETVVVSGQLGEQFELLSVVFQPV